MGSTQPLSEGEGERVEIFEASGGLIISVKVDNTDHACALLECRIPPYFAGLPVHAYSQALEVWYLLNGTLAVMLDGCTTVAYRGASFVVRPGVRHTFINPFAAPATLLVRHIPGGIECLAEVKERYGASIR